jgi:hypothetical protein
MFRESQSVIVVNGLDVGSPITVEISNMERVEIQSLSIEFLPMCFDIGCFVQLGFGIDIPNSVTRVCTIAGYRVVGAWTTGVTYYVRHFVSNAGKIYRRRGDRNTGFVAGATDPTHTSGIVSDGGCSWEYIDTAPVCVF